MLSLERKRNERIPNHPQMVQLSLFLSQDGGAPLSPGSHPTPDGKRRLEEAPAAALLARTHLTARRLPRPAPQGHATVRRRAPEPRGLAEFLSALGKRSRGEGCSRRDCSKLRPQTSQLREVKFSSPSPDGSQVRRCEGEHHAGGGEGKAGSDALPAAPEIWAPFDSHFQFLPRPPSGTPLSTQRRGRGRRSWLPGAGPRETKNFGRDVPAAAAAVKSPNFP